jgi:membrane associated rhomboid family serine protease
MVTVRSPTLTTLAVFVVVFVLQLIAQLLGTAVMASLFVLSPPVGTNPWTIVTSVYAHDGIAHLVANSIALFVPGLILERATTRLRWHLFFVTSGAIAGLSEITFGNLLGSQFTGVLGASGAVFALIGYLVTGNRLSQAALGRFEVSGRVQLAIFALIAVVVTVATGSPGVALIAHFTGLLVGLLAGQVNLLRVGSTEPSAQTV